MTDAPPLLRQPLTHARHLRRWSPRVVDRLHACGRRQPIHAPAAEKFRGYLHAL